MFHKIQFLITPVFLQKGMAVHHMLQQNSANFELYKEMLKKLATIIATFPTSSHVIWMNQYPTNEFYGDSNAFNTEINSEKINHYNKAVLQIFK